MTVYRLIRSLGEWPKVRVKHIRRPSWVGGGEFANEPAWSDSLAVRRDLMGRKKKRKRDASQTFTAVSRFMASVKEARLCGMRTRSDLPLPSHREDGDCQVQPKEKFGSRATEKGRKCIAALLIIVIITMTMTPPPPPPHPRPCFQSNATGPCGDCNKLNAQ